MGLENFDQQLLEWFTGYAYDPLFVYTGIVGMMVLSSFGLPLPEEVVLVSAGIVAHIGSHPEHYPPPFEGAQGVNLLTVTIVAFFAVFLSDLLIYLIGKTLGRKLTEKPWFKKVVSPTVFRKVERWMVKYGYWASGAFRFMPGIRFPGHMACGMMGVSMWKFLAVDGTAALISVPTQILLIGIYGRDMIAVFGEFKKGILAVILCLVVGLLVYKWRKKRAEKQMGGLY